MALIFISLTVRLRLTALQVRYSCWFVIGGMTFPGEKWTNGLSPWFGQKLQTRNSFLPRSRLVTQWLSCIPYRNTVSQKQQHHWNTQTWMASDSLKWHPRAFCQTCRQLYYSISSKQLLTAFHNLGECPCQSCNYLSFPSLLTFLSSVSHMNLLISPRGTISTWRKEHIIPQHIFFGEVTFWFSLVIILIIVIVKFSDRFLLLDGGWP